MTSGGTPQASHTQTYGDAANKSSVNENGTRLVNYGYDNVYRLLSETFGTDSLVYTLDAVGNRSNRASTLPSLPTLASTYDANDRLNSDTYDANGNTLTSSGNTYAYDFEDRLTNFNAGAVTMVYDGDGNRVARTEGGVTTRYLVDDLTPTGYAQVAEELQSGAVTRRYTHGPQRISQTQLIIGVWTTHYYGYDAGFSVRQLSNTSGAVTDTYTYDAFGSTIATTGSTPNAFLYRGEQYDAALGLYFLRARWYWPKAARFVTADTYEGEEDDPPSQNQYAYASADPISYIDPSGHANTVENAQLQTIPRVPQVTVQTTRVATTSGGRVKQSTEIAERVVCCLIESWSVLDLALQIGGAPPNPALKPMDEACQFRCKGMGLGKIGDTLTIFIDPLTQGWEEPIRHMLEGQSKGLGVDPLEIARQGASEGRRGWTSILKRKKGFDRDEWPPAMFKRPGKVSVKYMSPKPNRSFGSCLGRTLQGIPDRTPILLRVLGR